MADNNNNNLDERVTNLERQVAIVATKVDALSDKIDLVVSEMQANRVRQDADMREIRASIDGMGKHVRNLAITSMAAIGGMAIAVAAMVVAMLMK